MKILALDLGTQTGVAFGDSNDTPSAWTEVLGEAGSAHGARFAGLMAFMNVQIKTLQPDVVAIEQAIAAGVVGSEARSQIAMGLRACIMGVCHMRGVRCVEYRQQSVRAHFIGKYVKGTAKIMAADRCKLLGWHIKTLDEADACAVWDFARSVLCKTSASAPRGLFDYAEEKGRTP